MPAYPPQNKSPTKNPSLKFINNEWVPSEAEELVIPDEAIYFIVGHFLQGKNTEGGVPIVTGISSQAVEEVLRLFVLWAGTNKYINNGILTIGGHKIG